ncbi:MAG TPA: metallophosphoesterase [Anaerolineales bacterium]
MKIVVISDIHGRIDRLDGAAADLAGADLVVLTGDITNFGRRQEAERMLAPIEAHNDRILAVTGNCDYPEVEVVLQERGYSLQAAHRIEDGVAWIGLGGSLPAPGGTPNEHSEEELADLLEGASQGLPHNQPLLLISHQPPFDTQLDRIRAGAHVGSRSVRQFIERHQPLACFTGHIHEAAGIDHLGDTVLVNPGPLAGGGYAVATLNEDGRFDVELRRT